jgi:F-type H+-transporting ATPase subunit delta
MAELVTIARPYAEAVFRLAKEKGQLADWSQRLAKLSTFVEDATVAACLANPGLTAAKKAELVKSLLGGAEGDVASFIDVLATNGRLAALPEIAAFFETLKAAEEGVKDAVIQSAYPIDDAERARLMPMLEAHFKSKLRPSVEVEPELIGGIKVVVGDRVLDRSVRASLDAMAVALRT